MTVCLHTQFKCQYQSNLGSTNEAEVGTDSSGKEETYRGSNASGDGDNQRPRPVPKEFSDLVVQSEPTREHGSDREEAPTSVRGPKDRELRT